MLTINDINKMAYDQRQRGRDFMKAGLGDASEFFTDIEEAHIASIIVNFTANHYNKALDPK